MREDNTIMTKKTLAAFTLIELLVVVAIIGILGTLGTTSYVRALKNARDARRKSNVDDIASALDIYWAENNGSLPTDLSDAKSKLAPSSGDKLLNEWPTDTVSGYTYYYNLTSSTPGANTYVVCANVELTVNANSKDNWGSSGPTDSTKFFCKKGP